MSSRLVPLVAAVALALVGCAGAGSRGPAAGYAGDDATPAGRATVAAVGTPFLMAFKVPVCVATVAVAGPLAGLFALTDPPPARAGERRLAEGVSKNCGPPYTVRP